MENSTESLQIFSVTKRTDKRMNILSHHRIIPDFPKLYRLNSTAHSQILLMHIMRHHQDFINSQTPHSNNLKWKKKCGKVLKTRKSFEKRAFLKSKIWFYFLTTATVQKLQSLPSKLKIKKLSKCRKTKSER